MGGMEEVKENQGKCELFEIGGFNAHVVVL